MPEESCPESELNIPLEFNADLFGVQKWKRTNIIRKFCWACWHWHRHGVYKQAYMLLGSNATYICSACGHTKVQ